MKLHVPYNENNLKHQEPVQGISEWQTHNDWSDWQSEELEHQKEIEKMEQRMNAHFNQPKG